MLLIFNEDNGWFFCYYVTNTRCTIPSDGIPSYLRVNYDLSVIFLPLKIRWKLLSCNDDDYKDLSDLTICLS